MYPVRVESSEIPVHPLRWFQSCVWMKYRPIFPSSLSQLVCLLLHVSLLVRSSNVSGKYGVSVITHPRWSARLLLVETSCLSIITRSPDGQLRPMFMDVLLHHVLLLVKPSDVFCSDWTLFYWPAYLMRLPATLPKNYLNPQLPPAFPSPSTSIIHLSSDLSRTT